MYQHRDSCDEISDVESQFRLAALSEQEQRLLLYLLKRLDFPTFEQCQHISTNTTKEEEDGFFFHNNWKG